MRIFLREIIRKLYPKYEGYAVLVLRHRLKRLFKGKRSHKYLFLLCPPYCGSTLLSEMLATSKAVSGSNVMGYLEGQNLPTTRNIMFQPDRWDPELAYNWDHISKEWHKYWDQSKPILMDKSPPNLLRAKAISQQFAPAYFVIFYRNPYAHCESLIRRNNDLPEEAAKFAILCLQYQKRNLEILGNFCAISYENFTEDPGQAIVQLKQLLPELTDVAYTGQFDAHNYLGRPMEIRNLNADKIAKLTSAELQLINRHFVPNKELLHYFNYSIIEQ